LEASFKSAIGLLFDEAIVFYVSIVIAIINLVVIVMAEGQGGEVESILAFGPVIILLLLLLLRVREAFYPRRRPHSGPIEL